jgi:hypothetical protein
MGTSPPSASSFPKKPPKNKNSWRPPDNVARGKKKNQSGGDHQPGLAGECRDLPGNPERVDSSGFCGYMESHAPPCLDAATRAGRISARNSL